eukprot:GCRY01002544.1.p1 GENE.GCRY01002544.1~~GCRY01002544.1.p1  ORF type:complete len:434 (-),score=115.13 GCRY01002544.1:122-1423(-)
MQAFINFHHHIENAVSRVFRKIGRFNGQHPVLVLLTVSVIGIGLCFGMLLMDEQTVSDNNTLWGPRGSDAVNDQDKRYDIFGDFNREARLIYRAKTEGKALQPDFLLQVLKLESMGMALTIEDEKMGTVGLQEICARSCPTCSCRLATLWSYYAYNVTFFEHPELMAPGIIHPGASTIELLNQLIQVNAQVGEGTANLALLANIPVRFFLNPNYVIGGADYLGNILIGADALLSSFFFGGGFITDELEDVISRWENAFLDLMSTAEVQALAPDVDVQVYVTNSASDELERATNSAITVIPYSLILTVIYLAFQLSQGLNPVNSGFMVAVAGLISTAVAVFAGLGLSLLLGVWYTSITATVFFLALGIGMANTVLMYSSWMDFQAKMPAGTSLVDQNIEAMGRCGPFITITTLTTVIAFLTDAQSRRSSVLRCF